MFRIINQKKYLSSLLLTIFLCLFYFVLYQIYIPRINAFGCFDDCFNILGGTFILNGKRIYTDFFFNHQPGMAYLSALIQYIFTPESIPELILKHRQFIMILSFFMSILITFRYGKIFLLLVVAFELTKFYVFGDRFLAEGLVVYFLIYILGVILNNLRSKTRQKIDFLLMPFFVWITIFLREPFIPIALFLFSAYIFTLRKSKRNLVTCLILFSFLCISSFAFIRLSDFIYNVFTLNRTQFHEELTLSSSLSSYMRSFFYPFYLIISDYDWTLFRTYLAINSGIFLGATGLLLIKYKKFTTTLFVWIILMLSNLRPVEANKSFYEAFHIIPWYGLFLFTTIFSIKNIFSQNKKIGIFFYILFLANLTQLVLNRNFFAYEKVDTSHEYFINYSHVMGAGTVIRNLSNSKDTVFVDGFDELVMWEAKRPSPYQYTWYTSFMPSINMYNTARTNMFVQNPPDFYYGQCMNSYRNEKSIVSDIVLKSYTQLESLSNSTCIMIHNDKLKSISKEQKDKIKDSGYFLK